MYVNYQLLNKLLGEFLVSIHLLLSCVILDDLWAFSWFESVLKGQYTTKL